MEEKCATCYFKAPMLDPSTPTLWCRRYPISTMVDRGHWCGEYVPEDYEMRMVEQIAHELETGHGV